MSRVEPLRERALPARLVLPAGLVGVFLLTWSSVGLAPAGAPSSSWWPASGYAVVLAFLASRRAATALVALCWPVSTLAIWLGGRTLELSVPFGVAVLAEVAVATVVLRVLLGHGRTGRENPLSRLDDFWRIALASSLGALACSSLVVLTVAVEGAGGELLALLRNTTASHLAGTLTVVAAALAFRGQRRVRAPRWETTVQGLALALALALTVSEPTSAGLLALAPLPLLVWAGLRLGTRVVVVELIALAVAITVAARLGVGLFATTAGDTYAAYFYAALSQSYVICAVLVALPLALALEQRRELLSRVLDSERNLRRSFSESVVGLLELHEEEGDLVVIDLNDVAGDMIGGRRDEVLGRRLQDLFDVDRDAVRRCVLDGDAWRDEVSLTSRAGTRIGVAVSGPRGTDAGDTRSAQLVDLTPVREAHRAADRERELSRAVAETAACLILIVDVDGILVAANPAATAMLGWEEHDLVGRFVWELLPADRQGDLRRAIADLPHSELPKSSEAELLCRDGGRRRVLWSTDFARDPDGTPNLLIMTGIDVTDERRQRLMVSQLLEAAMTTVIIGADSDGRIAFFNTGAERLLGRSAEEAVGSAFVDVFDPEQCLERWGVDPALQTAEESFFRLTLDIQPGQPPVPEDLQWRHADGSTRTVSTTLSIVADPDLGVGFLCIGRDVTEQRQSQQLLMQALEKERTAVERLQALDHAKNDFVSTVSHELRTPVTSIVGYTEMLRDGTVDEPRADQAPFLDAIARNADRLIGLADDLLTLSGLESGAAELGREHVDLGALVERSKETLVPLLHGRDLAVTYRLPGAGDDCVVVHGDPEHLDRVLVNLVSNAVKFTDDGGRIEITVGAQAGEALLEVSDTGIGIPAEEQSRLFTKFFRSTTAQRRAIQGTGLGLSIVHSVVAAHGGRILVRSAHLAGTTFSVRLPLQDTPARPVAARPARTGAAMGSGATGQQGAEPARLPRTGPLNRG
ncbi:PAS domain S-box protein [Nocardioides sp. CFH 31398]|uniref:PAS domain S-box protein n=1 Tax=Nocardioides sp. CFH 31398 TaxID=2919579 RepID=UPI001F053A67|nr:PAS domain S-box protein [Nocardioides sp. CFH 31398]MCH1868454.1 PAS domain S-box protein [Nocardioides sp. CFH 31398]